MTHLHLTTNVIVITILATAFAATLSQMALAVFNDGVRPFLLDFYRGDLKRPQMLAIAFGLSAGFIFGLGVPLAFSSSILNPWLLFLPTDILGILSPKRWLAPILGAAWGAVVVFGLHGATALANSLPVDFLTAMQQMATPILYLFSFFPAVAIGMQFGKKRGILTFVFGILVMLATMKWIPVMFAGSLTMASGVALLIGFAVMEEMKNRREAKTQPFQADEDADEDTEEAASIFGTNARRLRKHWPWFAVMGILIGLLANTHMFAGGEATSYIIAKGQYANAAQIDFYRALGFLPLIITTSLASGAFQIVGFTLIYPIAYLSPNPIVAAVAGGVLFTAEVWVLSYMGKGIASLSSIRDASDNIRNAINLTLEVALLFGSILAGNTMAGGVGIAVVGGVYILNEIFDRPLVRMAAGPVGVILAGVAFNILAWVHLFTPIVIK